MDLKFVETLLLVVEEGSVAAAARKVNVTPAAVSQRIAAIEGELREKMLVRSGRVMEPTEACLHVLPQFKEMLRVHSELAARLGQDRLVGAFRLGAISTALADFGSDVLAGFQAKAPNIDLSFVPGTSERLFDMTDRGELEAAIVAEPPFELSKSLMFTPIQQQEIGVYTATKGSEHKPYVVYDRYSWGGAVCWQALLQSNPNPDVLCEFDAPEVIAQMVLEGLGQAVLPKWNGLPLHKEIATFTPLNSTRTIGLLCRVQDGQRPSLKLLLDQLVSS